MVGLIHKILFDLVDSIGGAAAVAEVKRRADVPVDKEFRMNAVYGDEEWTRLLNAACAVANLTRDEVDVVFAEAFYQDALRRWSTWFDMSRNSRELLERQPTIHNSLSAGMADESSRKAIRDKFRVESNEDGIITHYRSPNKLCGLYKGLARCIIRHYGDEATIEETSCMLDGSDECEIHVRWTRLGAQA